MLLTLGAAPGHSTILRMGTSFDILITFIWELTAPFAEDRKMKTQKIAAVLLTLALSLGASQGALADDDPMPACSSEVEYVGDAIADSSSLKKRDRDRLGDKVIAASMKLRQHKPANALQKIGDIRRKVEDLHNAPKTKISDEHAYAILTAVAGAESCINGIL
jgi:hypothetical protein